MTKLATNKKEETKAVATQRATLSQRFIEKVQHEFASAVGSSAGFTAHEKKLASNFYIFVDNALNSFEADRVKKNKSGSPIVWDNVNLPKLAIDAVHRIRLGLDALIPNHLHAVPYFNSKVGKYDLDLRIGYVGKLYVAKQVSLYPIRDIRMQLVHEHDDFKAIMKNGLESEETYEFDVPKPFNRGEVVGGFGYIIFEDSSRNKLILVGEDKFKQYKNEAQSNAFWGKWGDEMRYKTLAHRVSEAVDVDPRKIHDSYHKVQDDDNMFKEVTQHRVVLDEVSTPVKKETAIPKSIPSPSKEIVFDGTFHDEEHYAHSTGFQIDMTEEIDKDEIPSAFK